MKNRKILFCTL